MSKPSAKPVIRMEKILDEFTQRLNKKLEESLEESTQRFNIYAQHFTSHTKPGYAPWVRKRKDHHPNNHPSQVTQNIQTNTTTIPPWSPPQPTPHPPQTQSPTPMELNQPTTHQPTPPIPSSTDRATRPNQPAKDPNHAIPPLMSITFTPHTILRIKSRLNQHHTPKYQPHPPAPFIQYFTHLLQPIYTVLQTLCHTLHSMIINTQPAHMWNSIP